MGLRPTLPPTHRSRMGPVVVIGRHSTLTGPVGRWLGEVSRTTGILRGDQAGASCSTHTDSLGSGPVPVSCRASRVLLVIAKLVRESRGGQHVRPGVS